MKQKKNSKKYIGKSKITFSLGKGTKKVGKKPILWKITYFHLAMFEISNKVNTYFIKYAHFAGPRGRLTSSWKTEVTVK